MSPFSLLNIITLMCAVVFTSGIEGNKDSRQKKNLNIAIVSSKNTETRFVIEQLGAQEVGDDSSYKFETGKYHVTMTKVLTKSTDCAVLIVSATTGDYESNTLENNQLLNNVSRLGIKQLIVCVVNMEGTVPTFSEARFDEIKYDITGEATTAGFDSKFIPINGENGENIIVISEKMPWYKSRTSLLEAIDAVVPQ